VRFDVADSLLPNSSIASSIDAAHFTGSGADLNWANWGLYIDCELELKLTVTLWGEAEP